MQSLISGQHLLISRRRFPFPMLLASERGRAEMRTSSPPNGWLILSQRAVPNSLFDNITLTKKESQGQTRLRYCGTVEVSRRYLNGFYSITTRTTVLFFEAEVAERCIQVGPCQAETYRFYIRATDARWAFIFLYDCHLSTKQCMRCFINPDVLTHWSIAKPDCVRLPKM